jgi:3-methylcrotonyl-CoA carboxylase alpha subunit
MQHEYHYQFGDEVRTVRVETDGDRQRVRVGDLDASITVQAGEHNRLLVDVNGQRLVAHIVHAGDKRFIHLDGQTWTLRRSEPVRRRTGGTGASQSGGITAAMPGRVLDVLVAEGDLVQKGDALVLLEAMKMELRLVAPAIGRVDKILCQPGQVVARGQVLIQLAE